MPEKIPEGWWSVIGEGTIEGVTRKIDASSECPQEWKNAIKVELAKLAGKYNFVDLHAHCHYVVSDGKTGSAPTRATYHISITPGVIIT